MALPPPAGGDNTKAFLQPHQLRELCVMAGLDPAAPATHSLVDSMLARKDPETGLISFDACMQVALHYQVKVRCTRARLCVRACM